jgi:hypothetical protein
VRVPVCGCLVVVLLGFEGLFVVPCFWVFAGVLGWVIFVLLCALRFL